MVRCFCDIFTHRVFDVVLRTSTVRPSWHKVTPGSAGCQGPAPWRPPISAGDFPCGPGTEGPDFNTLNASPQSTPRAFVGHASGRHQSLWREMLYSGPAAGGRGAAVLLLWVEMLTESGAHGLSFRLPPRGVGSLTSGLASQRNPSQTGSCRGKAFCRWRERRFPLFIAKG